MVDTMAVVIEVGTMEVPMVDTMVGIEAGIMVGIVEEGTMEGLMVEVFTHTGDYGGGGLGDGLL